MTDEPSRSAGVGRWWLGCIAGVGVLFATWLTAMVAEPFLIAMAVPPSLGAEPRSSASGWANSNVWLAAELAALAALFFAGFVSKWLSPQRSWLAPSIVAVLCLAYIVFAQFPATRSLWRISLWSLGSLVAIAAGVWLGLAARRWQGVA